MKKRVVISGATGFVGANLAKHLVDNNFDVYVIVRENSDLKKLNPIKKNIIIFKYDNKLENLIDFFSNAKPFVVFHLASNFIAEHKSSQIDGLISSNISFGLHILEAMKVSGVKRLINTGTSWQHYNNEDYNPVCLYAATKQAFEALIEFYVKTESFKVITLKLYDTYGETDTRPKLINLLHKFADEETELKMSPGEQMLNLVHVKDVCNAFVIAYELLENKKASFNKSYAIRNQKSYQLKQVIEIFEKITGKKINILWGGREYRKREVMELWENGENLTNWEAKISLQEGLKLFN